MPVLTSFFFSCYTVETSAAKSYAAAGQFELMNLYQSLLSPKGVTASQMLLTQADFANENHLRNLRFAVERLLSLGIVPIINENDAVSVIQSDETDGTPLFSDNDSLAALCARTFGAEVLVLLTDVDGVYDLPPTHPKAKIIPFHHSDSSVAIGEKSAQGRGGMAAKIAAAESAVRPGSACAACVIAAGSDLDSIRSILAREYKPDFGPPKGTLFASPGSDLEKKALEELVVAFDVSRYTTNTPRTYNIIAPSRHV
jgi:delta-1-pyrroline-5-carboxylate synthetase